MRFQNHPSFILKSRDGLSWLEAPNLAAIPWLVHGFSTRAAGDFRFTHATRRAQVPSQLRFEEVSEYQRFLSVLQTTDFQLALVHQIHSSQLVSVTRHNGILNYQVCGPQWEQAAGVARPAADALITAEFRILLAMRTADCLPMLIADPERRVVAAIHAGWRGALKGIIEGAVREMKQSFDCAPRDLRVALGPLIRACCYAVGGEVVDAFCRQFPGGERFFRKPPNRAATPSILPSRAAPAVGDPSAHPCVHLDLVAVAVDQLESAGVPRSNIQASELCTSCRTDLFFSHRKEGAATGRMTAVIGMRPRSRLRP